MIGPKDEDDLDPCSAISCSGNIQDSHSHYEEYGTFVLNTEWAQVEVIDLINDGSGLAFGIIGGRSTGVVVKTILPGGVADRDGRLQSGDHILQIGEVNLRGLGSEQVASVLRQCGVHVRMVVARPVESTSSDYQALGSHAPIVPTKILGDPVELDRHLIENGYADAFAPPPSTAYSTPFIYTGQQSDIQLHPVSGIVDVVRDPLPIGAVPIPSNMPVPVTTVNYLPLDMALREPTLPETETFTVELKRDDLGLGITVAGYVCEKEEISGIFVKSISKGSAADVNRNIKINDRIVEVDGKSVLGCTNHQAVEILRNTGSTVTITFERYLRGPKYEQLQQAIKANELRPPSPPSPSLSSLPKVPLSLVQMSSSVIEAEGESRTSLDFDSAVLVDAPTPTNEDAEIVIGAIRKSVQFSIASQESIYDKWREKFNSDVEIVIAQMHKEPSSGLGISLEGTVDVEDGQEVRPHHYIRNILPDGPVGRNGLLQSGDELLEVNGIQLMGLNHLEVVSILKQLPNFVSLVCARYPVPTRIINTAQHRDAFEARNILAESLQTLIPSDKMVKAKSDTSIASSVVSEVCASGVGSRSRSLELVTGFPMWSDETTVVELNKGDHGLGFSILDYQDPLNPQQTVIVIRSLVPGGVAQADGQLIPGDRLLAVNDINVSHATLDRAVQVLKGAPKGPVKIAVAKPLSTHDNYSHNSQDTEDDQTCLEDFQECIEEYQECLEVVQICIDDETSFNHSPCSSQFEDFDENVKNSQKYCKSGDCFESNIINNNTKSGQMCVSNINSTNETKSDVALRNNNCLTLTKNDSSTQSDKVLTEASEKDGYETCIDESFSEDICAKAKISVETIIVSKTENKEDITPTNSNANLVNQNFLNLSEDKNISTALSEPCLNQKTLKKHNHLCLDSKPDDELLKSYDNQDGSLGGDEFFLVQYPLDGEVEVAKFQSEPNGLNMYEEPKPRQKFYRKCLVEYYNDYADCLEAYQVYSSKVESGEVKSEEMTDECIFSDFVVPTKSRSAPDIADSSFVTLTYDPGPDRTRRKSAFVCGYQNESESEGLSMTVVKTQDNSCAGVQVDSMPQKHWGSIRTVQVHREPNTSLGISIVGGKVDLHTSGTSSETILGIFVKNVVSNSPAGRTGQFKTGDRILEVSGIDLRQANHEKAVEAIRNAPNPVTFLLQSIKPLGISNDADGEVNQSESNERVEPPVQFKTNQNTQADNQRKSVKINENSNEKSSKPDTIVANDVGSAPKKYESSEESDDDEDVRDMEGRTVSAKGQEIDRASAANIKRTKEEVAADPEEEDDFGYTMNKVKKKYANLGHSILMVQLERSGQGLGLSLAGHKDRNCMAVFVCGINPTGAAYKTGAIQVGDEILEVNGVVLHGRCHLNASAIIKGLSGPIFKVIILRRKTAIDDIAVKPITQFPVSLAEEGSEEQFSNYPNVRTVTIKKGTQSLGIMIIEGKHAEVGQGIFISDIQEGSSAEKAGLEIGEMILAVNKDTLLGSNYDTAANLLKRTEGLVTLVVSNPGKKPSTPLPDGDKNSVNKSTLKTGGQPSRPATPVPEPPADPATCPITPGKDVTVEIATDNKSLGINFVGGKDTLISNGIVLIEVYPGGTADKDGRLQPGDQILDVNGVSLKDVTHNTASQSLRQTLPKMKLIVFRPEKPDFIVVEVDLVKKPGKGLGLSVIARKSGKGVYIAEIINGGAADVDGRIMKGDLLVSVNGQSVECSSGEEAGAILKTVMGKVSLKLHRYKPTVR